jgi:hypothetical protein
MRSVRDRLQEAKSNGWLGEVQGLEVSVKAAAMQLVTLDRLRERQHRNVTDLGIPTIKETRFGPKEGKAG